MRFFIALEIPQLNRQEIGTIQSRLLDLIPDARLTENDKLHLTIAFIGEHSPGLKEKLVEIISMAAKDLPTFNLTPSYIDAFPNLHIPHTIFLGVKGDVDKLFLIQERIKDQLAILHLEVDNRHYIPHIAIAKVQNIEISASLEQALENLIIHRTLSPIVMDSIKLFESVPTEGFHQHNILADIKLYTG